MKVVHFSTNDLYGAGRAAARIDMALKKEGVDSQLCVLQSLPHSTSEKFNYSKFEKFTSKFGGAMNRYKLDKYYPEHAYFHTEEYGIDFSKQKIIKDADILHFHWINQGIWSHRFARALKRLNKPIVWTLHDMWPFTGGCHYDGSCGKYKERCGACPVLCSNAVHDLSEKELKFKCKYFPHFNLQFVGCSQWITTEANSSSLIKNLSRECVCIPNPINMEIFHEYNKEMCRNFLGIKTDKKMILFGAVSASSDKRKGYRYLYDALMKLDPRKYMLGIFGDSQIGNEFFDYDVQNFGYITDDLHLAMLYNAADVFVAPSIQENLANTVMESLSCGTPVAAFHIGGMEDMIIHEKSGYLVEPYNVQKLAFGIEWLCSGNISRKAVIESIVYRFEEKIIAERYIDLYHYMIKG